MCIKKNISSLQNPFVKELTALRLIRKERVNRGSCLIVGVKMVKELMKTVPPQRIVVTEKGRHHVPETEEVYLVTEEVMKKISGQRCSDGVVAEFPLPQEATSLGDMKWLLVLDALSDPGNLGTLLRSAAALKWEGVYCIEGGCDLFHEKVLAASRGALFHLPYQVGGYEPVIAERNQPIYIADLQGQPLSQIQQTTPATLVLGHEAHGISDAWRAHATALHIPMHDESESLNVGAAGAIMLYHLRGLYG